MNLMPYAEEFEGVLLLQFTAAAPFEPMWIKLNGRRYSPTTATGPKAATECTRTPVSLTLVITGAVVKHLPFEDVRFLDEVEQIVQHAARRGIPNSRALLGAHSRSETCCSGCRRGYSRKRCPERTRPTCSSPTNIIGEGLNDRFRAAYSRFAGFDEATVRAQCAANQVHVLVRAEGGPAP